uniref:Keratin, type I cytoskeletal 13 n=1 Tax=Protopterus aethiopicus TaxID=7886 RepID=K1C13_PROAT|nr:RecName: Full=Keratin, type I cytoskeletal 13; AltName: Full=Cytokeratin-13; Short=CK-13; AltName: Full=Keratin-13; Short=K13 [Protopterus aethiopicus]CAH05043.1 type I keratin 13 [Protopterus aethiopicus]
MNFTSFSITQGSRPQPPSTRGFSGNSFKSDLIPQSRRSHSVYGTPGSIRISSPSVPSAIVSSYSSTLSSALPSSSYGGNSFSSSTSFSSGGSDLLLGTSGKEAMQNLNDRLASYLEKVRSLEERNRELEQKIREWYEKQGAGTKTKDFSHYFKIIADLQKQIHDGNMENAKILLRIDNAKLAADDFKQKWEAEQVMRLNVEGDINGLRRILDEMTLARADLEMQIDGQKEELAYLNKSHDEEMKALRSQLGGQVNVEVDAAPAEDLTKKLERMRQQYEQLAEKNRKDAEDWFMKASEDLNKNVASSTEAIQTTKTEINELKRTIQGLQIELQSQLSMKDALEGQLADTEHRYSSILMNLQNIIHQKEAELSDIRADTERQANEYKILFDAKTKLENEIRTYRILLEGDEGKFQTSPHHPSIVTKQTETVVTPVVITNVKTVVEEIIDGKIVSKKEYPGPPEKLMI